MKVLFVCVGNSARSQMAEGFARSLGMQAASAGTQPAAALSRRAVAVMAERGIDISGHRPKILAWDTLEGYDRVITMGCGVAESCPSLRTDEDWGLDDPIKATIEELRGIRDEIERRVAMLARGGSGSQP